MESDLNRFLYSHTERNTFVEWILSDAWTKIEPSSPDRGRVTANGVSYTTNECQGEFVARDD